VAQLDGLRYFLSWWCRFVNSGEWLASQPAVPLGMLFSRYMASAMVEWRFEKGKEALANIDFRRMDTFYFEQVLVLVR
jgi:hypothetical protein